MQKIFSFFLVLFIMTNLSFSQTAIGNWTDHFIYTSIIDVVASDSYIYAASENGIMLVDKTTKSQSKLSKVNGLSDIEISCINYNVNMNYLIIAYTNGNIDIIKDNEIINIPDVKNKQLQGNTSTYNITFKDEFAFLSTGFGIVKVDINKTEIAASYLIGENGTQTEVYQFLNDELYFYAATISGIYKAEINSSNLSDYRNWSLITEITDSVGKFNSMAIFADKIFVMNENTQEEKCKLIKFENNTWTIVKDDFPINSKIESTTNRFAVVTTNTIYLYNQAGTNIRNIEHFYLDYKIVPQCLFFDGDKIIYGDKDDALVVENEDLTYLHFVMNSPGSTDGEIYINKNKVLVAGGGKTLKGANSWIIGQYSEYKNGMWETYYNPNAKDYITFAVDDTNENHFFIGAWDKGIYEYLDNNLVNNYTYENSVISSWLNTEVVHISGLKYDNEGNLWILNPSVNPLNVISKDQNWESFDFNKIINNQGTGELVINSSNYKCFSVEGQRILFFDDAGTIDIKSDDTVKLIPLTDDDGKSIGTEIFSLEIDNDDNIWVGTDEGVAVLNNSNNAFEDNFRANRVKITGMLADTVITNYLLKSNTVTAIAVDGSNRKWFGTMRSGVYLMSDNGTAELLHFDENNSPLPSNYIISIGVDDYTGTVYFSTNKGLISYKSDAVEGKEDYSDVYVYPNPVRETYTGEIAITGLVSQTKVKITDIAGNLVYETETRGGQVTWNGNNFDGKRVSTGVYLVFCSNEDGSKTHVTKFLVIN